VSIAIIEREGRILIAKREEDGPLKNLWEFPGGKIEPGETAEECVRREVFEELGLTAERVDFLCTGRYDYTRGAVELFAFRIQVRSGEPGNHHYRTMKWVKPYELDDYDFPGANASIIQELAFGRKGIK